MVNRRLGMMAGLLVAALLLLLGVTGLIRSQAAQIDENTLFVASGGDCGSMTPCYATLQDAMDAALPSEASKRQRR